MESEFDVGDLSVRDAWLGALVLVCTSANTAHHAKILRWTHDGVHACAYTSSLAQDWPNLGKSADLDRVSRFRLNMSLEGGLALSLLFSSLVDSS